MAEDITENWQLAMTSLYSSKKHDLMFKITIDLSERRGSIVVDMIVLTQKLPLASLWSLCHI